MENTNKTQEAVYDASVLGTPKMLVLGMQHLFAMFGATVLVPAITGLNVSTTLFFAGLGTLLFHLITGKKVPAFLGSSFAFLGAYGLVTASGQEIPLTYSSFGVACAGLAYLVLAFFFKHFGARKVMRFFPPIVTGPIIICIGLSLAGSAINNCQTSWLVALVAIGVVVAANIWGKLKTASTMVAICAIIAMHIMISFGLFTMETFPVQLLSDIMMYISCLLTAVSGIIYVWDYREIFKEAK